MTVRHTTHEQLARPTQRLRDLLELLAGLRTIDQPLTSPEGLRGSLELLLRLAEFVGIEPSWTDRVRQILDDPRVFDLVLAVVRYLDGFIQSSESSTSDSTVGATSDQTPSDADGIDIATVDAQAFIDWLPIVVQILSLLNKLRGAV